MSIASPRRVRSKLRQERHVAVHAPCHMPLLTELVEFSAGVVPIDMALLTELDGFAGGGVAIDMTLLTELDDPRRQGRANQVASHALWRDPGNNRVPW
jgi:hypothetical protein